MRLLIIRMRKILLIIMLMETCTLWAGYAENTAVLPVDGYSAYIDIFVEPPGESVLTGEETAYINHKISTVFLIALQQTARFSTTEISPTEVDLSEYRQDTMVVKLTISQVRIETDPDSGKKIFQAEASAESFTSSQQEKDQTSIDFKLLGIGETFEASVQSAAANLTFSVMSIIRMFPLPGLDSAIYDLYNNYPIVLFAEEPFPSIGDDYTFVSGAGEILGLAEISRLIPLEEGKGTAAELKIMYTDISLVPGVALQPSEHSKVQIQNTILLSFGAVGADISFSGTKREGFVPAAGLGAAWIWDNPYPIGSFFVQQDNTILPLISCGFMYRMIPGRNVSKPGNLFIRRVYLELEASFVGGYLFNVTTPAENGLIYGSRFTAGISWYLSDHIEFSAKCRYDRIYLLSGSSDPLVSMIFGAAGVTFRL